MDWGFIVTLFGLLLIAGILVHAMVAGDVHPSPTTTYSIVPAPSEASEAAQAAQPSEAAKVAKAAATTKLNERAQKSESWCFVHEDYLGRWCVKTASPNNCDPKNRYTSKDACEMVSASALPLGPVDKRGTVRHPFAAMSNSLW